MPTPILALIPAALTAGEALATAAATTAGLVVTSNVAGGRRKNKEKGAIGRALEARDPERALIYHFRTNHGLSKKKAVKKMRKVMRKYSDTTIRRDVGA